VTTQHDACWGKECLEEQQWGGSGGETARNYFAGASATNFQFSLQIITVEGERPR